MSSEALLSLYHHLPAPLRSGVATVRGFYLRSWRYGSETEALVAEALDREMWTREQWKAWQQERLAFVLHRAATRVPFYRDYWAARRRRGDRASYEHLENWPIVAKETLRKNPRAFIADDCVQRRMFHEHTSGTTGKPLDLWWSRRTVRQWYALFEARCRRWHGVSRNDRWAILGGQLVTPYKQQSPPFWVWNAALNQLYMSSYHLAPGLMRHYFDALQRHHIKYLLGYPSALYALAQAALQTRRNDLRMAVVVTNAEPVFEYQRRVITEAFHCPVRETYGMAEIVAAASECGDAQLHMWPEVGWVEIEGGEATDGSASGDLICTGLLNLDMPLIRYRVGDSAWPSRDSTCRCGRTLPVIKAIEGRSDDVLYALDGRCIGRLDPVFKTQLPIVEAQIVQESLGTIRVRYVPTSSFTPAASRTIVGRLQERLGPVDILLEPVDKIPLEPNGKFRSVVCNLSSAERQSPNATRE